jgi:PhzF family phenazine biosynthesis protein
MRQWTVDAFAARPFKGNPACVVEPFDAWPEDGWMQALAQENNQAETAYLLRTPAPDRFGLRWFTPGLEAPLCGHATLASAHVLFAEQGLDVARITFDTRSGPLIVERDGEGYRMDFPADPPRRTEIPAGLAAALGAQPVEAWAAGYLVAVMADEATVRALTPDVAAVAQVNSAARRPGNVIVAAAADASAPYQLVSRFFAPGSGVAEDPTTGSAHTILAPLYAGKLGRNPLACHQAFPGRGGDMTCEVRGERVILSGRAVTVVESRLRL